MATIWLYAIISVVLVSLVSFVGIFTISISQRFLQSILFFLISFAVGALLGDAMFHLLPEAIEKTDGLTIQTSLAILAGILIFFILEKLVIWRHCHLAELHEHHAKQACSHHIHPVAYNNLIGDGIHNFLDGAIIAAAYMANIGIGIATTIAVVLHEIPQEVGDFGVLIHSGFSRTKALLLNFATAITAVAGAVITLIIGQRLISLIDALIPFTVGAFLYIASSDLIPELHKETKLGRSLLQIIALIAGLAVMFLLLYVETN
ncbi:MAG: hypothetical protein A2788_02060 [Candidatus Abawacabacteria bacterium RIFCSPHIGHO2_01_FULL_46_8]|uniref:ZIP family metal transporter n=1 Tax=Candidatus Abawacabacteria bacterium RIFCSPHIGHO2_01_FULL_46_8 TaxID=1817815 RepID=A0A1F4XIX0_9BACT|nr:MAG: hypothetical protein A2788_02060 [Candidatus Abawacabacteria bacterium RIFCSPHIGHO2_01_FULL_46_8]